MGRTDSPYLLALMRIIKAISSSRDLKEVLSRIAKSICETTGSKGCTLMLLNERDQSLEIKSSFGLSDRYVEKGPVSADRSISDTLHGKTVIIEDAARDPRIQYPEEAKREGVASIVSTPMILRGTIIGVLRLYTSVPCRFTEEDIDFLSALAIQSGLAIENAKLHELMKTPNTKHQITDKLQ